MKLSDYNSELLNTSKSSGNDFDDQEDDVSLLYIWDENDMGEGAYVTDSSFLWEDLDNYITHWETFTEMSGLNKWTLK